MQTQDIIKKPLSTKWVVVKQNYKPQKEAQIGDYQRNRLETVVLVSHQRYEWDDYYAGTWKSDIDHTTFKVTTGRNYGFKVTDGTNYRIVSPRAILGEFTDVQAVWAVEDAEKAKRQAIVENLDEKRKQCEQGADERAVAIVESYKRILDKLDNGLGNLVRTNWFRFRAENYGTDEAPNFVLKPSGQIVIDDVAILRLLDVLIRVEEIISEAE